MDRCKTCVSVCVYMCHQMLICITYTFIYMYHINLYLFRLDTGTIFSIRCFLLQTFCFYLPCDVGELFFLSIFCVSLVRDRHWTKLVVTSNQNIDILLFLVFFIKSSFLYDNRMSNSNVVYRTIWWWKHWRRHLL